MNIEPVTPQQVAQLSDTFAKFDAFKIYHPIRTIQGSSFSEDAKTYLDALEKIDQMADKLEAWMVPSGMVQHVPSLFYDKYARYILMQSAVQGRLADIMRDEGPTPLLSLQEMEAQCHEKLGMRARFGKARDMIRAKQLFNRDGELRWELKGRNTGMFDQEWMHPQAVKKMHNAYIEADTPVEKMGHLLGIWAKCSTKEELETFIPKALIEKALQDELRPMPQLLRRFALFYAGECVEGMLELLSAGQSPSQADKNLFTQLHQRMESLDSKLKAADQRADIWPPNPDFPAPDNKMANNVFPDMGANHSHERQLALKRLGLDDLAARPACSPIR